MSDQTPKDGKKKTPAVRGLHYTLRLGSNAIHLPHRLDELYAGLNDVRHNIRETTAAVKKETGSVNAKLDALQQELNELHDRQLEISQKISDLQHKLRPSAALKKQVSATTSDLLADDHDLDDFYIEFENKFRGTEAEIKNRLRVYVPKLKKLGVDFAKHPLLDIGCGRGELLELLKEEKINAVGLDLNESMVRRCNERGLKAVQAEALGYLRKQPSASLGAVTGIHLVEHIPFGFLLRLFEECYRVLMPGGVVIFETPNPESLHVGSFSFYNDPSHLHPLTPNVLAFAIENRGFDKADILRLHPRGTGHEGDHQKNPHIKEIIERFYMAQDYAVVGHKAKPRAAKPTNKK